MLERNEAKKQVDPVPVAGRGDRYHAICINPLYYTHTVILLAL